MLKIKTTLFSLIFLPSILDCVIFKSTVTLKQWLVSLSHDTGSCSEYFEYGRIDDFINGKLELPNIKIGDTVKLLFSGAYTKETPNSEAIFLPDESPQSVIDKIQNGQLIKYRVDFPVGTFVPQLYKIGINGNELCTTRVKPTGFLLLLQHKMQIINGSLPVFTYNINIPNFVDTENANSGLTPLTYGGTEISRGEYPWLTAIYKKQRTDLKFICGGSLVTSRLVLTAAHCFNGLGNNAKQIVAMLGRHDLTDYRNGSLLIRQIETLIVHPEYQTGLNFSDADIALLKMKNDVSFTKFIKPICMWSEPSDQSLIVNQIGVVAGWGGDAKSKTISTIPKKVQMAIVSGSTCLRSSLAFTAITSARTFCAGNRDGTGPCEGDSGGGLMMNRKGQWTLRGVVSAGLTYEELCDLRQYAVYCDIAKHLSWLKQYVKQNEHPMSDPDGASCGISDTVQQKQPTALSVEKICGISGKESRTKHSWFAAIYSKALVGLRFRYTGILISARSVLTRADVFVYSDGTTPSPDNYRIYLGRNDLNSIQENFVVRRDGAAINLHPGFKFVDNVKLQEYNLAVLQMNAPVSFTEYVKPICLWKGLNDGQSQIGAQSAAIAGWEAKDVLNDHVGALKSIEININSIENCESWGFNASISSRMLCIPRLENQTGNILMFKHNGRWVLRGINTLRLQYDNYMSKNYIAYSDIAKYLPWIERNIS